jgi:hypothetical protein
LRDIWCAETHEVGDAIRGVGSGWRPGRKATVDFVDEVAVFTEAGKVSISAWEE